MGMSELNSLIIMSFAKGYRINLKHPRKIFLLRLFFVIQIIINLIKSKIKKRKHRNGNSILNSEDFNFSKWLFSKRISNTLTKILFHFLSGTYSLGLIYYSLSKEILSLPFFISGF